MRGLQLPVSQGATLATTSSERRLRQSGAWSLVFLLALAQLGAIWDRQWHHYVGRDSFFIPPHDLIYSGVTLAGIVTLFVVLTDTLRYHGHAPGVDDQSTIRVFGWFHAPLGYVITGFGVLDMLASAPLDNYWHELYGIDVVLWAPFHLMGISGGLIGMLGMMYIFGSEEVISREEARATGAPRWRFLNLTAMEWGMVMVVATFLAYVFTGFLQLPVVKFGLLQLPTSNIALATSAAFAGVALSRFTHVPGVATYALVPLAVYNFIEQLFLPWGVSTFSAMLDMPIRTTDRPTFSWVDTFLPIVFIIPALIIDYWTLRRARRGAALNGRMREVIGAGALVALFPPLVASCLLMSSLNVFQVFLEQPSSGIGQAAIIIPPDLKLQAALIAIPTLLVCGIIGALGGALYGDIWRWNAR